jgi:hypothetical protein
MFLIYGPVFFIRFFCSVRVFADFYFFFFFFFFFLPLATLFPLISAVFRGYFGPIPPPNFLPKSRDGCFRFIFGVYRHNSIDMCSHWDRMLHGRTHVRQWSRKKKKKKKKKTKKKKKKKSQKKNIFFSSNTKSHIFFIKKPTAQAGAGERGEKKKTKIYIKNKHT